jgi:benzoyl-CoA reductase subunit C
MRRQDPDMPVLYIHFPQNLGSSHTRDYLYEEFTILKEFLEELSGNRITDEDLRESFREYNHRSDQLKKIDQIQTDHPERLSASESYVLRLAGMVRPVNEHSAILQEALELKDSEERHTVKLRMVLSGAFCERPPVAMLETLEEQGVGIVRDDLLLGQSWFTEPLPSEGDPIGVLTDYYLNHSVDSSVVYRPGVERCERLLEIIRGIKADGVIIATAKSCHPANLDSQCILRMCEEQGLPYIRLEYEEDRRVFESLRVQVEALFEARSRLPFAGTDMNN